jgi:REP-associated tyrosine transposase
MSRPLRIEYAGAIYHVCARGNGRQAIFLDDDDRGEFLHSLWSVSSRLPWRVWAYCLMGNHYHLLLETLSPTLSQGMRDLNGGYSQSFNRRYERVGHVFQGRYGSTVVDKEAYLLELARYIILNPVRAGLCRSAEDWPWSSYRATIGLLNPPAPLAAALLLGMFAPDPGQRAREFARFVRAGLTAPNPFARQRVRSVLGGEPFVNDVGTRAGDVSPEVPRVERAWKSLAQYEREAPVRDEAIYAAHGSGAYTLAAIGRHFGLSYQRVSRIVRAGRLVRAGAGPVRENARPDPNEGKT